ncbi:hypothetical protein DB88DRAFT_444463, partial [Papiliotrema laurentii]
AVLVSDLTSLRDRDPLQFCLYLPWLVASPRVAEFITEGISAYITDGWRCGCGVVCIVLLVLSAPVIGTMFWGDRRAKEHGGASSVRSSDLAAELILIIRSATDNPYRSSSVPHCRPHRPPRAVDLAFRFGLLLVPFSLAAGATNGYKNRNTIVIFDVGGILLVAFPLYEWRSANYSIMPRRLLNHDFDCH